LRFTHAKVRAFPNQYPALSFLSNVSRPDGVQEQPERLPSGTLRYSPE
jgi:hypothetical protein